MKHLLLLILFIGISQFGHSQSACDNWKQIQGKSESDFTDIKRLKIYWSKRCACESGQITGGTWDYTVELVNSNYDMYHERRNKFPKEYSYNGPLVPDRKISVNECNSDNNLHINDAGTTNCDQKAFNSTQDPQNFANDFMRARCQCMEGVPFEEDAKKLAATMQINYQNAKTYYGNSVSLPAPLTWTECPILEFGGEGMRKVNDPNQKRLIKDEYLDLLNLLNDNIESELLSETTDDLNYLRDYANNLRTQFPDQADKVVEMENVGMVISVTVNLLESFLDKIKANNTPEVRKTYYLNMQQIYLTDAERSNYHVRLPLTPSIEDYDATVSFIQKIIPDSDTRGQKWNESLDEFYHNIYNKLDYSNYNSIRTEQFVSMIQNDPHKTINTITSKVNFLKNEDEETKRMKLYMHLFDSDLNNPELSYQISKVVTLYPWKRRNPDWTEEELIDYLTTHAPSYVVYVPLSFNGDKVNRIDGTTVTMKEDALNNASFVFRNQLNTENLYFHGFDASYNHYLSETYLPVFEYTQNYELSYNKIFNNVHRNIGLKHGIQPRDTVDIFREISFMYERALNQEMEGYQGISVSGHTTYQNFFTHLARLELNSIQSPLDYESLLKSMINNESAYDKDRFNIGLSLLKSSYFRNIHQPLKSINELAVIKDTYVDSRFTLDTLSTTFEHINDLIEVPYRKRKKKELTELASLGASWNEIYWWVPFYYHEEFLVNIETNMDKDELYDQLNSLLILINEEKVSPKEGINSYSYYVKNNGVSQSFRANLYFNQKDFQSTILHRSGFLTGNSKEEVYIVPFSSLRLYRYYLGKTLNKSEYLESDSDYIRNNLVYVLEDYVRNTTNYEPALFVLKDLGIIE